MGVTAETQPEKIIPGTHNQTIGSVLGYVWLCALAASLLFAAFHSYHVNRLIKEYAYGTDSFGYLTQAREIRQAARNLQWPQFPLRSTQPQTLIRYMLTRNVPLEQWRLVVSPHAALYFPKSNEIGLQYPPGTGLLLAAFPEGKAFVRLNKTVIYFFALIGLTLLLIAAKRRAWAKAGFAILPLCLGLKTIDRIDTLSFSINAILPVLLLMLLLLCGSLTGVKGVNSRRLAWLSSFAAGLLFGLAVLIRLPVLLLGPVILILLFPCSLRSSRAYIPLLAFAIAAGLSGMIPLFLFQHQETGFWYLPTYAPAINSAPSLAVIGSNLRYYFVDGPGSADNWALLTSLVGYAGFVIIRRNSQHKGQGSAMTRLALAAFASWFLSTAYFLTHDIQTPYYMVPGAFACVTLLALAGWIAKRPDDELKEKYGMLHHKEFLSLLLAVAFLPGIITIAECWKPIFQPAPQKPPQHHFSMPAELSNPRAWIWADFLSGTFWYYGGKPAYRLDFAEPSIRALIYDFASKRGDPQYLVDDSPFMRPLLDEIPRLGGTLERRPGTVDGAPYFLIHWPAVHP